MNNIVYIDILILINAIISYFLLKVCIAISQKSVKTLRLCAASALAGVFALSLFLNLNNFLLIAIKIASAALIVFVCFGFKTVRVFLKHFFLFLACNIAFGGFALLVIMLGAKNISFKNYSLYINISPILLIACILLMYVLIQIFSYVFGKFTPKEKAVFSVMLESKTIRGSVLLDTGMNIKDVMTGKNVALCSYASLKEQLPQNLSDALNTYFTQGELTSGLWLISVKTASGMSMMPVISAKELSVRKTQELTVAAKKINELALCFTNELIADASVDMLINPHNLQES